MDISTITLNQRLQGFTITEIMVGVLISSVLMAGVLTILSSSKRTYALQYEMALLQDNARFIMEDLTYNIRMAGYYGCSTSNPSPNNKRIDGKNNKSIKDNQNNNDLSHVPASDSLRITAFSNSLLWQQQTILQAQSPVINLLANSSIPNSNNTQNFEGDTFTEQIFISDCGGSFRYSFQVDNSNAGMTSLTLTPVAPFKNGNFVWPIEIFTAMTDTNGALMPTTYEVRGIDNNDDGDAADPEDGFALFKNSQLFVEGVENMQVLYGIKNNSTNTIGYSNSPAIDSSQEITSVRLSLLMRTAQRRGDLMSTTTQKEFVLSPDLKYNPGEKNQGEYKHKHELGYRHRLFATTIYIRNRANPLGD